MPSMDELYKMQDMGADIYNYLKAKVVESLIIEGINYKNKGILKSVYKYLREDYDIAYAICRLYPDEIKYSNVASNDVNLCYDLISNTYDNSIYGLDNLVYFNEESGIYSNYSIVTKTIDILASKLENNPKYRFSYKENKLLDDIFGRIVIPNSKNLRYEILPFESDYFKILLMKIEPAYGLILDKENKLGLSYLVNNYIRRYHIDTNYENKDILTNQTVEVKRLIKCINQNNNKY